MSISSSLIARLNPRIMVILFRALSVSMLLLILWFNVLAAQQSPYAYKRKTEVGIIVGGTFFSATGNLLKLKTPGLTALQIQVLYPNRLNRIDRSTPGNDSETADLASDITYLSSYGMLGSLLFAAPIRKNWRQQGLLIAETLLVTESFTSLTKALFHRPRPYVYDPLRDIASKQSSNSRHSFISGHTSHTAAGSFYFAKVFSDYFPDSKWKIPVWIIGAGLPALTGYLRVQAGKHFPTDVITGYIVGGACGLLIPHMHKNNNRLSMGRHAFRLRLYGLGMSLHW